LESRALAGALAVLVLAGCGMLRPAPPGAPRSAPAPAPGPPAAAAPPSLRLDAMQFSELEGWTQGDPRGALQAFLRSCAVLAAKSDDAPLGGVNYAGVAVEWRQVCGAASLVSSAGPAPARGLFELEFVPYRVGNDSDVSLFTGHYEPQLRGSRP